MNAKGARFVKREKRQETFPMSAGAGKVNHASHSLGAFTLASWSLGVRLLFPYRTKLPPQSTAPPPSRCCAQNAIRTSPRKPRGGRKTAKSPAQIHAPDRAPASAPVVMTISRFNTPQNLLNADRVCIDAQTAFLPPKLTRDFPIGGRGEIARNLIREYVTCAGAF